MNEEYYQQLPPHVWQKQNFSHFPQGDQVCHAGKSPVVVRGSNKTKNCSKFLLHWRTRLVSSFLRLSRLQWFLSALASDNSFGFQVYYPFTTVIFVCILLGEFIFEYVFD